MPRPVLPVSGSSALAERQPAGRVSAGPHRCLGSHLARVEMQIIIEVALSRLGNIRLDPQHPVRYHGGHIIGPDSLWLLWDV